MNTTLYQTLKEARDLIVQGGWCQGSYELDGRHCLIGALTGTVSVPRDVERFLVNIVYDDGFGHWPHHNWDHVAVEDDLVLWNDTPGRTQAEVLDLFDRAIMLAEAELAKGDPLPVLATNGAQ